MPQLKASRIFTTMSPFFVYISLVCRVLNLRMCFPSQKQCGESVTKGSQSHLTNTTNIDYSKYKIRSKWTCFIEDVEWRDNALWRDAYVTGTGVWPDVVPLYPITSKGEQGGGSTSGNSFNVYCISSNYSIGSLLQ